MRFLFLRAFPLLTLGVGTLSLSYAWLLLVYLEVAMGGGLAHLGFYRWVFPGYSLAVGGAWVLLRRFRRWRPPDGRFLAGYGWAFLHALAGGLATYAGLRVFLLGLR